jgi:glycosyltransferase involved in cell wall biosynthesis
MIKVLLYSDCPIFGGSENILVNLIGQPFHTDRVEWVFAFRRNEIYLQGFQDRYKGDIAFHALPVAAFDSLLFRMQGTSKKSVALFLIKAIGRIVCWSGIINLYNFIVLTSAFRKIKPDIVHINNGGYPAAASCRIAVFAARAAGITQVVFTVNNLAFHCRNPIERYFDQILQKYVKCFTTASFAAAERLASVRNFERTKILSIPNTAGHLELRANADRNIRRELGISEGTFVFGTVGLLTKRKGHTVLIEAIAKARTMMKDFLLIIVGNGEERENLEKLIIQHRLSDVVRIIGFSSDVACYMKSFNVLVVPSIANEDFPYVTIEAMYLRVPSIGTNIAGIPEQIVDGVTGWVVRSDSIDDLAEALIKARNLEPNDLATMSEAAFARYKELYSYRKIIEQYFSLYRKMHESRMTASLTHGSEHCYDKT